jgi:hypothetical protein
MRAATVAREVGKALGKPVTVESRGGTWRFRVGGTSYQSGSDLTGVAARIIRHERHERPMFRPAGRVMRR